MADKKTGWLADKDLTANYMDPYVWQPLLEIPGGGLAVSIWFTTEEECLDYIRNVIVGQGMYDA